MSDGPCFASGLIRDQAGRPATSPWLPRTPSFELTTSASLPPPSEAVSNRSWPPRRFDPKPYTAPVRRPDRPVGAGRIEQQTGRSCRAQDRGSRFRAFRSPGRSSRRRRASRPATATGDGSRRASGMTPTSRPVRSNQIRRLSSARAPVGHHAGRGRRQGASRSVVVASECRRRSAIVVATVR